MSICRKKTAITLILAILFTIAVSAVSAQDNQDEVRAVSAIPTKMWVAASEDNNIPVQIDVFKKKTGGTTWNPTYSYLLCLPGNAVLENCFLSWDSDATATVNGASYTLGNCPIPPVNTQWTYSFKSGNKTTSFTVITYKGSVNVPAVFIDIDESTVTIAEMDNDPDHETECSGWIYIDGIKYELTKMKGRGNATWKESDDKKPYNITLKDKINFPGIDSGKTKKWSLLAECLDRSLLGNRSGYHLAHELGIGQDTASADVWMNGEYQGCYTVTPKTDSFVTKSGFMIEQDNYLEDPVDEGGDPQFTLVGLNEASGWSSCYNRITVKKMGDNLLKNEEGVVDESPANLEAAAAKIQSWLQDAWDAIRSSDGYNSKGKYYTDYIDIVSFAKMYLMHEYVKSYDVCAGSILFHRDGNTDNDKLIAGPLWDLDNAMGSTYRNSSLGEADDQSHGDRRSAEGDFIQNITEYKTSIYKTISKHPDFMAEVIRQYNLNKAYFDGLADDTAQMISEIEESAVMNHIKVNDLGNGTGKNNHYYSRNTTLGSVMYQQTYVKTTSWQNYTDNLETYISVRSLWFSDKYTHDLIHHDAKAATCTDIGWNAYDTCSSCNYTTYTEIPALGHDPVHHDAQAATCTDVGWNAYDTCSRCDYSTYEAIPALGHDLVHHAAQAATCTEIGWNAYDTCSRCDYSTCEEIPALGHDLVHHAAQAATCTEIGWNAYDTCSRCDYSTYEEIAALGHDLVHHTAQAATCTEIGWNPYDTCSRCNYTTYIEIPALGHDLVHHEAKAATCTAIGWNAYDTCSRCGYSTYEAIPALGHDLVHHEAKAATCTEIGWNAYDTCSRCDYSTYEEIPALGHNLVHHATQAATCTAIGWNAYDTCSRCSYSTYKEITALGHDLVHHKAKAATCTEIGWNAYDTCSRCDYSTYEAIPALGHDLVHHEAKAATCTEIGWNAYDTCLRCSYSTYIEIAALGHDLVHHKAQAATCTEIGWNAYDTCSRCDYSTYEAISALGHDLVHHEAKAATCTEIGWNAYDTCSRCDYSTYEEIPALGHNLVHHAAKAATCTAIGWNAYDTCSRCDYSTYEAIPALGHDLVHHAGKAATCTEIGWDAYDTCSRCDYSTYKEIPALGHNLVHHAGKAATCTAIGWNAYDTCSRCSYSTYKEIAALGHDLVHHEAQAATCTEIGWNAYDTCPRCGYSSYESIPALGHDLIHHEAQAATCTGIGWKEYDACSRCDYSTCEAIPALGHDLIHHEAQEATCTEIGWSAYDTCSRCSYSTYKEISALGHDLVHHAGQAATCTESGWNAYDTCKRCEYTTYKTIAAFGHNYSAVVTEPTCTEKGYTTHTCTRCGDSYMDSYTSALSHSYAAVVTEPTCTERGYTTHTCTRCGDSYADSYTPAIGHNYAAVVTEPSCTGKGYTTHTCTRCNDSYVDSYTPALGHALEHHDAQAANCTKNGWNAYDTCSRCGYSTYKAIPALGHDLVHHNAQAATCTENGWNAYDTCSRCSYSTYKAIPALGHSYNAVVKEPTCTDKGYTTHTCTRCSDSYIDSYTSALGHALEHHEAKAATCTENGWDAYDNCKRCGYTTYKVRPALKHDWQFVDFIWTGNDQDGYSDASACYRCRNDATHTQTVKATLTKAVTVQPACTESGVMTYTASYDGHSSTKKVTTAPHGHKFSNYTVNNDADFDHDGTKTAVCEYGCGTKDTIQDTGSRLEIKAISIASEPKITTYDLNESLVLDGGKIAVSLTSGKTLSFDITEEMVSGFDSSKAGTCDVKVSFRGFSTSFKTTIVDNSYIRGDFNRDKKVTDADAVYLLMHTFFESDYPLDQSGDLNGDNKVSDADAVYLLMYTFFPEEYQLH